LSKFPNHQLHRFGDSSTSTREDHLSASQTLLPSVRRKRLLGPNNLREFVSKERVFRGDPRGCVLRTSGPGFAGGIRSCLPAESFGVRSPFTRGWSSLVFRGGRLPREVQFSALEDNLAEKSSGGKRARQPMIGRRRCRFQEPLSFWDWGGVRRGDDSFSPGLPFRHREFYGRSRTPGKATIELGL